MSEGSSFTIDKVGWVTNRPGNSTPRERVIGTMWAFVQFLQNNGLSVRTLAASRDEVDHDEFSVCSDDLTSIGLAVVKASHDKWLRSIDRGRDPSDTKILDKELAKQRTRG